LLLQVEIPELSEKRVLAEVQHRRSGILFPLVRLFCPALLWFRCSGILSLRVWLSDAALLGAVGSQPPHVRAVTP
jgi:hypothetical protein